jgi:hypothetical protein
MWKMYLCMAICAEQDAFACFDTNRFVAAIGQRTRIQFKFLVGRIAMMPSQCGLVSMVSTTRTFSAELCEQHDLAASAAGLLGEITLMQMVGVGVLATTTAILALPTRKAFGADKTTR